MTPATTSHRLHRLLPVVTVLALVSCSSMLSTSIAKILKHPREYDGKTVTVSGTVKQAVNLLFIKYYVVDDGSGSIPVVTKRAVPSTGEKVSVTGRVDQAFALGDKSLLVIVEEPRGTKD